MGRRSAIAELLVTVNIDENLAAMNHTIIGKMQLLWCNI